ncbi:hypothetical protein BSKO_07569 [Bryopsis sp. KO-2023]|nr:hypothetical protein BSKO_07569 [Bryopsis sp. KO-2023]
MGKTSTNCAPGPDSQCNPCVKLQPLMKVLKEGRDLTESSDELVIVPLDWLIQYRNSSSVYISMLDDLMTDIARDRDYIRFGGSDHVFMCLSQGCGRIMMNIIKRYNLGKDTRAMWLGSEKENLFMSDQWPCPDRVLKAPDSLVQLLGLSGDGADQGCGDAGPLGQISKEMNIILKTAWSKIQGKDRHQGCILASRDKVCVSGIPKCGSSTMNILLRRMNGIKSWNDTKGHTHGSVNGLHWVNAKKNFTAYQEVMNDPSWIKLLVVREPASRVLSAYLDKILNLKEFGRIGYHGKEVPSFDYVLDHFVNVTEQGRMRLTDPHFRPMSEFASTRLVRYDFVARIESLADDLEVFLTSLGLWDKYGASGWGINGDLSFTKAKRHNAGVMGKGERITNETLRKIYTIYKEDYARFAYSMKETWGVDLDE